MTAYEIDGVVPVVDPEAFVHPDAVLIGDVIVGPDCYIGPAACLRADFGRIRIGAGSNVQDCCAVHCFPGADTVVEPGSHIGHGAVLHGCHIETDVLVGMNAVIMDGVRVGAGSLVGACSLLPAGRDVPPGSLAVGNPVKTVRPLDERTARWKSNGVRVYQQLARRSRATLREVEPLTAEEADRKRVSAGREVSIPLHEYRSADTP